MTRAETCPPKSQESTVRAVQRFGPTLSWLLPFLLLVLAIVVVPLRLLDSAGLPRYRALKAELGEINAENETLRGELRDLSFHVEALRHDPTTIEQIARDELGMVREGELVFQFSY